jgi:hypothetical protein
VTERHLPSNHNVVTQDGQLTFHFFVDSAEGVAVPFDAIQVLEVANAAERRLAKQQAVAEPDSAPRPPYRG